MLRIERLLPAPPPSVWAAFTSEHGLAGWWWTHLPGTTYSVDLRIGGHYRIDCRAAGIGVHGEYLELAPMQRLVPTWIWVDDGVDGPRERIALTFRATPAGTSLVVEHDGARPDDAPAEAYRQGWSDVLDALETALSAGT